MVKTEMSKPRRKLAAAKILRRRKRHQRKSHSTKSAAPKRNISENNIAHQRRAKLISTRGINIATALTGMNKRCSALCSLPHQGVGGIAGIVAKRWWTGGAFKEGVAVNGLGMW